MKKKLLTEHLVSNPATAGATDTPFEALASICSVLVVGLFILTFLAQNYVIPSGSMENTLLIGDRLVVDHISLAPPAKWMPLMHYREPRRGDIVVFLKPVPEPQPDAEGDPNYIILVKRLIGVPGDHIHLNNGIVCINGVAQPAPKDGSEDAGGAIRSFSTNFRPNRPRLFQGSPTPGSWTSPTTSSTASSWCLRACTS